jgi:lipopolysaccharide export system protein LptA
VFALLATSIAPRTLAESAKDAKDAKDAKERVEISAEKVDLDIAEKRAVLEGRVRLSKGSLVVRAPKVEVRYDDAANVKWARATGGVSAEMKDVRAEAPEVELSLENQTLALRGGVRLSRGAGWIRAERAKIELSTMKVSLEEVKGELPVPEGKR